MGKRRYPLTYEKACHAKWLVLIKKLPMTTAALRLELNVGSVSRAIHGVRFPESVPLPLDDEHVD